MSSITPLADTGEMIAQFREMLSEIATTGLTVDPATEANANLCMVSLSRADADALTPDEIASFLHQAADTFDAQRQSSNPDQGVIFYSWVDEVAGQLRFSVVSSMPLPFGCSTNITDDASVIAQHLLGCPYLDGIPFSQLESTDTATESQVLDVFVKQLPRINDQT